MRKLHRSLRPAALVHFATRGPMSYMEGMKILPRPVAPKSALHDLWTLLAEKRAHKWPLLGLSAAMTWLIVWAFIIDGQTNIMPRQNKIIYFQSWDKSRPDSEIIREQISELAAREKALVGKQQEMQAWADRFGIEWREEKARNDARRAEALRQINAMLEKRLADALAREAAQAAGGAASPPAAAASAKAP